MLCFGRKVVLNLYVQFQQQVVEGYIYIFVVCEVLFDLDMLFLVYLKFVDGFNIYLFEFVEGGECFGCYLIIGLLVCCVYVFYGYMLIVCEDGQVVDICEVVDLFVEVEVLCSVYLVLKLDGLLGFIGGLVGWFGFECIGYIELCLVLLVGCDELGMLDILLLDFNELVVFDNFKGWLYLIVYVDLCVDGVFDQVQVCLDVLIVKLCVLGVGYFLLFNSDVLDELDFVFGFICEGFVDVVQCSKEYICVGDIFQVVFSQCLSVLFKVCLVDVYCVLCVLNLLFYMYFLDVGDLQVVGFLLEILVCFQDGEVIVCLIVGICLCGVMFEQDLVLEVELLVDLKECVEYLMLIDFGCNDVGCVLKVGIVEVGEQFVIECYSYVMYIVSEVIGQLQLGLSYVDVLCVIFFVGMVSGVLKICVLEVICELELIKCNVYVGSIGYIGWYGDVDIVIVICIVVIKDGCLYVQVGVGIVYDLDLDKEWDEMMNKGCVLFCVVVQVVKGL